MAHSQHKPQPEISSPDSISASSSVLGIPELLGNVLAQLPARDLLMFQCINKTWHAVIKNSNTLQEKLFYKCDLVTMRDDMDESDFEINPFFLLLQRRWAFRTRTEEGATSFKSLDYPEASWKKMYLTRPAVWKISILNDVFNPSSSDFLVQIIQHDTIKMNLLLKEPQHPIIFNVHLSQTDGIRLHHLLGWNLSVVSFLALTGDVFMDLINYGYKWPTGCPETSLRQFYEMYVDRGASFDDAILDVNHQLGLSGCDSELSEELSD